MNVAAGDLLDGAGVIEVDGDEILSEFAAVMFEWGHYRTACGLRFPAQAEAREAAAGRCPARGRSRLPDGTWEPLP